MALENISGDPLEHWIDRNIFHKGPGFYLADAYSLYHAWMLEQQMRPVLGKTKFCWKLEAMFDRSSRKGVIFFKDARLKGGRTVYRVWKGEGV